MTVWVALLFWSMMLAAMLRMGSVIHSKPSFYEVTQGAGMARSGALGTRFPSVLLSVFSVAPLVFILSFRKDVGTDYRSYVEIFERLRAGESLPWIEPFYTTLNLIVAPLGTSGVVYVFGVSALLSSLPLFYRVFRSSPMPWLGVVIVYGLSLPFFMTNGVRSAIAIGIAMLIIPCLWRRQFAIWSLGTLFAAGFHFTVLMMWPLYFVVHFPWPRVIAIIGLLSALLFSSIRSFAVAVLQFLPEITPSKYSTYPQRILDRQDVYQFGFGYLIYIFLVVVVLVFWKRAETFGRHAIVCRNISAIGLILSIGFYQTWALNRLSLYFMPVLAIFLPWIIKNCISPKDRVFWSMGLAFLFFLMFARGLVVGSHHAVPYQWVF